ncbi:MAG: hypothetical protein ABJO88_17535 [Parasphingorhabdus sp.]
MYDAQQLDTRVLLLLYLLLLSEVANEDMQFQNDQDFQPREKSAEVILVPVRD